MLSFPLKSVLIVTLLAGCLALLPQAAAHAYDYDYSADGRQIDSAQKARMSAAAAEELTGPGAVFDRILGALSRKTDFQNDRLKTLWAAIPKIPADLYRVFVTL
jgi:hypothetical protein